ncbi:VWA domain-containing protein [uncultured Arcticibacterium sp.]|uniref:VWA domain-containing protein n=1 Tax=uncultured Arcticibacterium sp. TaxID=2173042 RepID=UPI0030F537A1
MMAEWFSFYWFSPATLRGFIWANPMYLYLILGIPLLFILRWFFGGNTGQKLNLTVKKESISNSWLKNLRFVVPAIFGLATALLLLALARPQRSLDSDETLAEGINIIIALDVSESMRTADLVPNRLSAAKLVALQFLDKRANDKIGLVVFAGESLSICPLTSDYDVLADYLDKVSWDMINASGTAIGNAIATSINRLRDASGESKAIILLSDGDNTAGNLSPESASDLAKSFGIRIYTIAVGTNIGVEATNAQILNKIATNTDAMFYSAVSRESLLGVFENIDGLEKTRFAETLVKDVRDYYYIYLNWSLLAFILFFLLRNTFLNNALED